MFLRKLSNYEIIISLRDLFRPLSLLLLRETMKVAFSIVFILLNINNVVSLNCKDNNNQDTDWWFIYQLPKSEAFMYYDELMSQNNGQVRSH